MKNKSLIFSIPPDYRRHFILMAGDLKFMMRVNHDGICMQDTGGLSENQKRMVSQFIGESINQVRSECEK